MPANRPEDLHELFLAAANAHDLDGLMTLYEQDTVGMTVDGRPITGSEAMREFLGSMSGACGANH